MTWRAHTVSDRVVKRKKYVDADDGVRRRPEHHGLTLDRSTLRRGLPPRLPARAPPELPRRAFAQLPLRVFRRCGCCSRSSEARPSGVRLASCKGPNPLLPEAEFQVKAFDDGAPSSCLHRRGRRAPWRTSRCLAERTPSPVERMPDGAEERSERIDSSDAADLVLLDVMLPYAERLRASSSDCGAGPRRRRRSSPDVARARARCRAGDRPRRQRLPSRALLARRARHRHPRQIGP